MNTLDLFFLIVIGTSGVLAVVRGFFREVLGLLGWAVAFVVASRFFGELSVALEAWIHQTYLIKPIAFFLLFAATLLVAHLFGQQLQKLVGKVGLSVADRFMGLCFGLARGVLILMIGFVLFENFYQGDQPVELLDESALSPHLAKTADWMSQQLSSDWMLPHTGSAQDDLEYIARPTHP